jgi:hypothetical protein
VASWSRLLDPIGRIWYARFLVVLAAHLRWQERRSVRSSGSGISNKAVLPSLWRLCILVLLRSARCSSDSFIAKSSRWRCGAGGSGGAFFNKRECVLLWLWSLSSFLPLYVGHGGYGRGGKLLVSCSKGGDGGISELIHDGGLLASTILCRHGGEISTSTTEALHRSSRGCSKPLSHEVTCSSWLGGGPRLRIHAGRGLPSRRPLLLGGDALRTPAIGGGDAQGRDCILSFSSRVFCVKIKTLSSNSRFLRTSDARVFMKFVPATFL